MFVLTLPLLPAQQIYKPFILKCWFWHCNAAKLLMEVCFQCASQTIENSLIDCGWLQGEPAVKKSGVGWLWFTRTRDKEVLNKVKIQNTISTGPHKGNLIYWSTLLNNNFKYTSFSYHEVYLFLGRSKLVPDSLSMSSEGSTTLPTLAGNLMSVLQAWTKISAF